MEKSLIERMQNLFRGQTRAYGVYDTSGAAAVLPGEKVKGKPKTVSEPVTDALWAAHLDGRKGLGIIPIQDNSKCFFGAIDIDIYKDFDKKAFIAKIYSFAVPVIPVRSKSGGLHLFLFLKEEVPAKLLIDKLKMIANYLGQATEEIFPKQTEVLVERNDIGNWINMPYYHAEETDRHAYNSACDRVSFEDFLALAEKGSLTAKELRAYTLEMETSLADAPPCIQAFASSGIPDGSRNEAIFAVGVYMKRAHPHSYREKLEAFNAEACSPRLSSEEVLNITKSLDRKGKDYFYTCDRSPCKDFCNKEECRNRKYGIGSSLDGPELEGLTKFNSDPPIWFVEVKGHGRVELSTEDLQNQGRFQRRCMEVINHMPATIKTERWQKMLSKVMEAVTVIEVPADARPQGLFYEMLERFCVGRSVARSPEEIRMGKPWTENGRTYFRLSDLMDYLERKRFHEVRANKILSLIQEMGGSHKVLMLKGVSTNVWHIPAFAAQTETFETPEIEEKHVI